MTFANALSRFAEVGCIAMTRRGRGGRERVVLPGPGIAELAEFERRLADSRRLEGVGRLAFPIPSQLAEHAPAIVPG